jgi:SPP1 family predicted phage head-tail adaptor
MMWRDVISLVSEEETENELGDVIPVKISKQVFANKKSIRQNEFYQAAVAGLRPEIMFEIRTSEYQGEPKVAFNGKEYTIIRTYDKNGEITELVCSGLVNEVM